MILPNYPHPDNFGELLGYEVTGFDKDAREARVSLRIQEKHLSPSGKSHGGVLSAVLDFVCGAAVVTTMGPNDLCSTVELKVNYFHPVNLGDELEAVATVVFRGRKLCALNATMYRNGEKVPVAMATATYNIVEG